MRRKRDRGWSERGQVLVLAMVSMVALLGFVAMAVDVGLLLHERRTLQNAADAAALAGAAELPDNPALAVSKAQDWAAKNGVSPGEIDTIQVQSTYVANDTMYVALKRDFNWLFGRVVGMTQSDVGAHASALLGSPAGVDGLKPWSVTNEVFQDLDPGESAVLKYDANHVMNGNFGALALDGNGANVYRNTIKYGSNNAFCVSGQEQPGCPSVVSTEPGNMTGPTRQGVEWLLDNTPDSCNSFDEVFTSDPGNPGEYNLTAACNPWSTSQPATLLAVVPVIDQLCSGRCDVTILSLGLFFIEGLDSCTGNDCEVTGKYVEAVVDFGSLIGPYDPEGSISFVRLTE